MVAKLSQEHRRYKGPVDGTAVLGTPTAVAAPPLRPTQRGKPACHGILCRSRAPVQRDLPAPRRHRTDFGGRGVRTPLRHRARPRDWAAPGRSRRRPPFPLARRGTTPRLDSVSRMVESPGSRVAVGRTSVYFAASGAFSAAVYTYWSDGVPWYYAVALFETLHRNSPLPGLATSLTALQRRIDETSHSPQKRCAALLSRPQPEHFIPKLLDRPGYGAGRQYLGGLLTTS
jgi:hypothetical protein